MIKLNFLFVFNETDSELKAGPRHLLQDRDKAKTIGSRPRRGQDIWSKPKTRPRQLVQDQDKTRLFKKPRDKARRSKMPRDSLETKTSRSRLHLWYTVAWSKIVKDNDLFVSLSCKC